MKREAVAWTLLALTSGLLIAGALSGDDAEAERQATEIAKAFAEGYESARDSVSEAHEDTLAALHTALEAERDTTEAHEERSAVADASHAEVAARLRPQIRAELREEFDALIEFHEVALAESDSANASLKRQNTLLRSEVDAERTFRIRETERADSWKAAFEAAEIEIEALRGSDIRLFGVGFDVSCGPSVGPSVGVDHRGEIATSLARLECEAKPS